jgi:hypothetical protein
MKLPNIFKRIRHNKIYGNSPEHANPIPNREPSTIFWSITAILLSFLCLAHLGVLVCFVFKTAVSPLVAPAALLVALAIGYWLAGWEGLRGFTRFLPLVIAITVVLVSVLLASAFFDMSWDGLWYQQTAVYQMSHGWNPLYDPMHEFQRNLQDWERHYAKGPWYIALALFQITRDIEWSKAATWMALAATFFSVFAVCSDFGMRRMKSAVLAALVALNPVVTCQLASYLVDGLMISCLACFLAATLRYFRQRSPLILCVMATAAILCINAKLNGLVYMCFFSTAFGLYAIFKRRDTLLNYAIVQAGPYLLGIFLFGFNPFVTNTVHRGNPFYPLLGSAAFPSHDQQGRDPVELYETPKNMVGRNIFYRYLYGIFGRPGSQPFFEGNNAHLMWPFDIRWRDINFYYFHEVRIAGFGPLFSGAFVIGFFVLIIAMIRPGIPRGVVLLFAGAVVATLLISRHLWWARFAPQLWWLPIIAVIAGLAVPDWRAARWAAGCLAALLLVNAALVAGAHFRWEIEATRKTYEQLAFLRDKGDVEVNFPSQYFREPFGERLKAAGVKFHAVRRFSGPNPISLMSVAPGYPGEIRACLKED